MEEWSQGGGRQGWARPNPGPASHQHCSHQQQQKCMEHRTQNRGTGRKQGVQVAGEWLQSLARAPSQAVLSGGRRVEAGHRKQWPKRTGARVHRLQDPTRNTYERACTQACNAQGDIHRTQRRDKTSDGAQGRGTGTRVCSALELLHVGGCGEGGGWASGDGPQLWS